MPCSAPWTTSGGRTLAEVYGLLEPGGCVQSVGMASGEADLDRLRAGAACAAAAAIEAFTVGPGFGPDLAYLIGLVAAGQLDPQIGWRGPWDKVGDAAAALLGTRGARQGGAGGVDVSTLAGQRVVVVGGTSGMGLATVTRRPPPWAPR